MKWFRRTYNWIIQWAEKPQALWVLSGLSVIEAIFFPLPADPLLIAMGAARPKKSLKYALVMTLSSVLGGILGYALGKMFWQHTQGFFFEYVFSAEVFNLVGAQFHQNAFVAIFLASFTPIPFKVFTVAAGVFHIALIPFILGSLVGRGLRFFLIGGLLYFFGKPIRTFIEKHFEILSIALAFLLVFGFYIIKYLPSS